MTATTPVAAGPAKAAADAIANLLTTPPDSAQPHQAQSLADGAAGATLLHIERAIATGQWDTTHRWLRAVVNGGVLATIDSSLYQGAPAVAFILHAARRAYGTADRYGQAIQAVDRAVMALAHRRVDQALARIARHELPAMAEYDIISGLTGIGAHLLRNARDDDALPRILAYLVRLTRPLRHDDQVLPGWWTALGPHARISAAFPGGHANHGLAHGICGPLALLALAARRGIVVDGHSEAIERVCAWLDRWRQHDDNGTWWPQWITQDDRQTGRPGQTAPLRPSWCYGIPGIVRAQQLAAIATGDPVRQRLAEHALASCLADPGQVDRISDLSLCHGWAGLLLTVWRTAADAATTVVSDQLAAIADRLLPHATATGHVGDGLLEGRAGAALALHAAARGELPASEWDACLLIT